MTDPAKNDSLRPAAMRRWGRKQWIHAVDIAGVLIMTWLLAWMMKFDPFSIIEHSTDFNSTDFYDRVAYENSERPTSTNVVIVAVDSLESRGEVGDLLLRLGRLAPAAIGLDVMMVGEKDPEGEMTVLEAMDAYPGIVLPVEVDECGAVDSASYSFYYDTFPDYSKGVVTFISIGNNGLERFFITEFELADGTRLPSMGLALARAKDEEATRRFMKDAGVRERVNFNIAEPEILYPSDIRADNEILIKDKIVLVGDIANATDMHNTSINGRLPGIMLHAAAAETILTGRRIAQMPDWVVMLVAFAFVGLVTVLYSFYLDRPWHALAIMAVKLLLLALILFGGYWLYSYYSVTVDFTYTIAVLGFSLLLCDLWFSLSRWLIPAMKDDESVKNDKA